MSGQDDANRMALTGGLTTGAVSTMSAMLSGADLHTALGIGGLSVIPTALALAHMLMASALERRAGPFVDGWRGRARARSGDAVPTLVRTPQTEQAVEEGFRVLLDAVDDAAAPFVGRLVAEYTECSAPPDPLLRGCGRVLRDATRADLEAIVAIAEALQVIAPEEYGDSGRIAVALNVPEGTPGARILAPRAAGTATVGAISGAGVALARAIFLLKSYGVAEEAMSTHAMRLDRITVERLGGVFRWEN